MTKRRKKLAGGSGCGYLLLSCLFTCFLLIVNIALVNTFHTALVPPRLPGTIPPRVDLNQLIALVVPVAMLFPEWWLIDLIVDRISARGELRQRNNDSR